MSSIGGQIASKQTLVDEHYFFILFLYVYLYSGKHHPVCLNDVCSIIVMYWRPPVLVH